MKVGDKVICVNDKPEFGGYLPVKRGEEYDVVGVSRCSCGSMDINIGIGTFLRGVSCGCGKIDESGIWWLYAKRFRKLETYSATENCVNFNTVEEGLELTPELV